MEAVVNDVAGNSVVVDQVKSSNGVLRSERCGYFQMPVHYPRYSRGDYESMPEWQVDRLLAQYGVPVSGDVTYKRNFAMGAFLWPSVDL